MADPDRTTLVTRRTTFKLGVVIGAVAMYLLDPAHGAERRARLRERLVGAPRAIAGFVDDLRASVDHARDRLSPSHAPGADAAGPGDGRDPAWPAAEERPAALR